MGSRKYAIRQNELSETDALPEIDSSNTRWQCDCFKPAATPKVHSTELVSDCSRFHSADATVIAGDISSSAAADAAVATSR
jgi:hypothetical protein